MSSDIRTSAEQLLQLQKQQFEHDKRNHCDILSLHKIDRLKHYGLHFCKYVGRLARGASEVKSNKQTLTDSFLVCLSAANTLHQRLEPPISVLEDRTILTFADAAGRFADACEKIDHLEEFTSIAKTANYDIFRWILQYSAETQIDLESELRKRRKELGDRHFYL